MDTSIWQDEAELANVFVDEESDRSSFESSSPGFNFNSTTNLKKNLTATFEKELSVDHPNSSSYETTLCATRSKDQSSLNRPPLPTGLAVQRKSRKSKKNFAVYLRIRPLSSRYSDDDIYTKKHGQSTIEIIKPSSDSENLALAPTTIRTYPPDLSNSYKINANRQSRDQSTYSKEFNFDQVMGPGISQENVYSTVAAPLIQDLLDSSDPSKSSSRIRHQSALLFSYGITNAGKTYSILGDLNSTNQAAWGIIPRAINEIFQRNRVHPAPTNSTTFNGNKNISNQLSCNLYISFFEIYNENVFDLMPSNNFGISKKMNNSLPALKVRECRSQIFLRGLTKHKLNSVAQGIKLTKQAHKKRHTSSNNLNSDSSRSHFVCQIQLVPLEQPTGSTIDEKSMVDTKMTNPLSSENMMGGYSTDEEAAVRSKLRASTIWIVDLAGSERSKRTRVGGTRQKESSKINSSLMTLMRCLNAMNKDSKKGLSKNIMPFRESKLTHIFMSHLTSASAARTAMMVNVNPSVEDFDETQHVLAYSRKAKLIEIDTNNYGMKRKDMFGEKYDKNGRKKPRLGDNSHPSNNIVSKKTNRNFLSRIAKKLSPKKATTIKSISNGSDLEEIQKLKVSLQTAEEKINSLQNQNMQLHDELESRENQIRSEVSIEMEKRLRETRTKLNAKYEHLRAVMSHQASKTNVSVSMNRAGNQLEELMDKIDECEKEMIRMSQEHQGIISILNNEIQELSRKQKVAVEEKDKDRFKILGLEEALEKANEEITRMKAIQSGDLRERYREVESKDIIIVKPSKCKRNLRPRKPLGNSTNKMVDSRTCTNILE